MSETWKELVDNLDLDEEIEKARKAFEQRDFYEAGFVLALLVRLNESAEQVDKCVECCGNCE